MMRETRAFRDLPLRVTAFTSRAPGDNKLAPSFGVIVMGEPVDAAAKLTAVTAGLVDSAGKIVVQLSADEKQLGGRPIVLSFPAAQGTYRLRFAATDATGKGGAVDQELQVELTPAGPLKLGSLVLTAFRNNSAVPALIFRDEEKIVGVLEMYGQLTGKISARMEIAASLDGEAIATVQPGGRQTSEPDKFILTGELPIAVARARRLRRARVRGHGWAARRQSDQDVQERGQEITNGFSVLRSGFCSRFPKRSVDP